MRHMTGTEKMAVRLALGTQRAKLKRIAEHGGDPHSQAGYRKRLETIDDLVRIFANENAILLPFEGIEVAKAAGAAGRYEGQRGDDDSR